MFQTTNQFSTGLCCKCPCLFLGLSVFANDIAVFVGFALTIQESTLAVGKPKFPCPTGETHI
jgi:hypothetical protein